MSKLFISYRRKSWAFTQRLAEELERRLEVDIFVDIDGIDEDDFERVILKNLRESAAVLLVISETTFAYRIHRDDDWVRREIREALENDIPIVLVAIEGHYPPSGLPEDIKDVVRKQGIPFYPDFFSAACDKLADFVVKIGAAEHRTASTPVLDTPPPDNKPIQGLKSFNEALALLDDHDFAKGIFILEELVAQGFEMRVIDIQDVLASAYADQLKADRFRYAKLDYEEIIILTQSRYIQKQALPAWEHWCSQYSDLIETLDTEKLREKWKPRPRPHYLDENGRLLPPPPAPKKKTAKKSQFILPEPFAWVNIPVGQVTLENDKGTFIYNVPAFQIAKYPIIVAQYELFVNDDGYDNADYWTQIGWQWRENENISEPYLWHVANHPVVGVSWYEAYAFSQWLAQKTRTNISLPTEKQWQRAAEGDEKYMYP